MSFGENIRSVYSTPKQVLIWENFNMKMNEIITENTASAVSVVVQPMGMKPIRRNTDGTVPNALDGDNAVLSGGVKKRKTKKKA